MEGFRFSALSETMILCRHQWISLLPLITVLVLGVDASAQEASHAPCDDVGVSGWEADWCDPSDVASYQRVFGLPSIDQLAGENRYAIRVTVTGAWDAPLLVVDVWGDGPRRSTIRVHRPDGASGGEVEFRLSRRSWSRISRAAERVSILPSLVHESPAPEDDAIVLCHGGTKIVELRGYGEPRTLLRFACRAGDAANELVALLVEIAADGHQNCRANSASELAACRW